MEDSMFQPMNIYTPYWHVSKMNVVKANSSTYSLVELKLVLDPHKTTTSVDTYMSQLSSIIEPPSHLSYGTGKSTKVLDIISFLEIVSLLTGIVETRIGVRTAVWELSPAIFIFILTGIMIRSGWKTHHLKPFSKVDPDKLCLFESGELPSDGNQKRIKTSEEEKKRKLDDILLDMRAMCESGQESECFEKFPRNWLIYGERIKAMIHQKKEFKGDSSDPHIWLYGYPGTGKTSILQYVYPDSYKKNLYNKFFDLYDSKVHTHIILEDLDYEAVDRLSINFLKTLCDKQGFAIDQKYKTPQLTRSTILVTSNFSIPELLEASDDRCGLEITKVAILRRFFHVRIDNFLRLLNLKMVPKWDQKKLQEEGNNDLAKLFVTWDYVSDSPMCEPVKTPAYYQTLIKEQFYK